MFSALKLAFCIATVINWKKTKNSYRWKKLPIIGTLYNLTHIAHSSHCSHIHALRSSRGLPFHLIAVTLLAAKFPTGRNKSRSWTPIMWWWWKFEFFWPRATSQRLTCSLFAQFCCFRLIRWCYCCCCRPSQGIFLLSSFQIGRVTRI